MANFFKDNEDLQYYFDKGIDWDSLVRITEHDFADAEGEGFGSTKEAVAFYRDIIEMFGQFVAEEIKPHEKQIDDEGVASSKRSGTSTCTAYRFRASSAE
jgi:3-(methylthio)propanoyl-CoA dehydrogenase